MLGAVRKQIESITRGGSWALRAAIIMTLDVMCVVCSYALALLLRFDFVWSAIELRYVEGFTPLIIVTSIVVVATFWFFRLYHSIWSFASFPELVRLILAWFCIGVILPLAGMALGISMPASYWLVGDLLGFTGTTAIRFSWRLLRLLRDSRTYRASQSRVLVVGAGESARALIREIKVSPQLRMHVVCAVDDNRSKQGRYLEGVPVVGGRDDIEDACAKYNVEQIIFAIPSCSIQTRKELLEICTATGLEVKAIPGIYQLVDGRVTVSKLREVRLEDLLGREPVVVDAQEVRSFIEERVVLVTGGGGSIGSELCRQIAQDKPRQLVIFDVYENNAYAIQQELLHTHPELDLVTLIGSVRDEARVREVFETYRPNLVFHAAAHKHVPLMEVSPAEAVKNNVFGTLNCVRAAVASGADRFLLISTDKAVNPTNVMGATKRVCEMIMQAEERHARAIGAKTTFSAVRFGNVLGSNGSVVPLFEKQIADGGPVTVTHPDITRFFMTIPEAVSLVLQSACYARGGEIFVLDMGNPVRIDDMARNLIQLAGYEPDVDIQIVYTGLRPGEKLYEERLMDEEGLRRTANELISIAQPIEMNDDEFMIHLDELAHATDVRQALSNSVPTYQWQKAE